MRKIFSKKKTKTDEEGGRGEGGGTMLTLSIHLLQNSIRLINSSFWPKIIALLRIVSYFSYSSNHKYFQSNVQRTQIIDKKWMPSSSFLFRYFFLNIYIYIFHPRIYHALRTRTLWRNFSTLKLNLQRKISISSHCLEHALSFTPRSFVNRKNQIYPPVRIFFFFL